MILDIRWHFVCVVIIVLIDCYSAYRLSIRVKINYPDKVNYNGGKLQSDKVMSKFYRLFYYLGAILFSQILDTKVMVMWQGVYLSSFVTMFVVGIEIISITENWSSCNDSKLAKLVQRVVVDKTKRHLDVDLTPLISNDETKI